MHKEQTEKRRKEADPIEQNRLMGTAKDTHTHTHTNTETRQLGGILNWRPLVLSLWPQAMLCRIEPAFISDAGFRVVWPRISPCCSFEVFIYHKKYSLLQ